MGNVRLYPSLNTISLMKAGATMVLVSVKPQPVEPLKEFWYPVNTGDKVFWLEPWKLYGYSADPEEMMPVGHPQGIRLIVEYKDESTRHWYPNEDGYGQLLKVYSYPRSNDWRSSITMPNAACRFVWTVGSVEAVQVKDISHAHICKMMSHTFTCMDGYDNIYITTQRLFEDWFKITYPNLNPDSWVWVIEKGRDGKNFSNRVYSGCVGMHYDHYRIQSTVY